MTNEDSRYQEPSALWIIRSGAVFEMAVATVVNGGMVPDRSYADRRLKKSCRPCTILVRWGGFQQRLDGGDSDFTGPADNHLLAVATVTIPGINRAGCTLGSIILEGPETNPSRSTAVAAADRNY